MAHRRPRLMRNGYYNPNRRILYKERPARMRLYRMRRTLSVIDIHDYEILQQRPFHSYEQMRAEFTRPPTEENRFLPVPQAVDDDDDDDYLIGDLAHEPLVHGIIFYYLYIFFLLTFIFALVSNSINMHKKSYKNNPSLTNTINEQKMKLKELEMILHKALKMNDSKMADYALESLGTTVKRSSQTYKPIYCNNFYPSIWCNIHGPETVLQSDIFPGKCWAFKGSQGHLVIALSRPVRITHVTLEHLASIFLPTNDMQSVPKDFAVYGLVNEKKKGKLLGKFTYDQKGEPSQTFEIMDPPYQVYGLVALKILSNYGDPEYTRLYRFKVHSLSTHD